MRREAGAEASLVALRIAPDQLNAVVRDARGKVVVITVDDELDLRRISTGGSAPRGLSLRRISPRVPQRIVRAAAERAGLGAGDVDYVALAPVALGGGGIWTIVLGGTFYLADLDGSNVRRSGA